MSEPGLDRHEWESEWATLEPAVLESPREALPELDALVRRMLEERRFALDDPVAREGEDPEIVVSFLSARAIARQVDRGDDVDPGDIAQAVNDYRELYEHLLNREIDLS